jgi:PAS domain S-box-containing protein
MSAEVEEASHHERDPRHLPALRRSADERSLRESEERFRSLVRATAAIVWTTHASGELESEQLEWAAFTGQSREEYRGRGWLEAIHPDDRAHTAQIWEHALENRAMYEVEHRLRRHDGEYRHMHARAVPILDDAGNVREWVGIHTDITGQRQAQAERERLIAALAVERERLQHIFREAPAFIATLRGPEHVFETVNPPYLQLIGHRDVIGKPVGEALPEVVEQGFIDLLDNVLGTGESFVGKEMRVLLQRKPGSALEEVFVNFVYQPIAESGDAVSGIFVHGVEVTEQVRARHQIEEKAAELEHLAAALERSNRELDQFAYVTSHDLKAPLRGIANLSQWVEEDLGENITEEVREHLSLMRGRVHRMEALIEGILEYSRAGRVRGEVEPVDVGGLLHEIVDLLNPPEGTRVEIADGMPSLFTERLPLQQVFMNLIGNAVKYAGRDDAHIRIEAVPVAGGYRFDVTDDGPGIAPEYHDRIFGIFQTLHARDEVEGTGIGLSLVRKIVGSRGGRVWVESAEGEGASFRFIWPV